MVLSGPLPVSFLLLQSNDCIHHFQEANETVTDESFGNSFSGLSFSPLLYHCIANSVVWIGLVSVMMSNHSRFLFAILFLVVLRFPLKPIICEIELNKRLTSSCIYFKSSELFFVLNFNDLSALTWPSDAFPCHKYALSRRHSFLLKHFTEQVQGHFCCCLRNYFAQNASQ